VAKRERVVGGVEIFINLSLKKLVVGLIFEFRTMFGVTRTMSGASEQSLMGRTMSTGYSRVRMADFMRICLN
jgi:hypothetical protein